jgi:hypothetical protein
MTPASWLLTGGAIGALNGLSVRWMVARLRPDTPHRAVAWALGGALLRWGLAVGLLVVALQHGTVPALLAFVGLWLARWGVVCGFTLHS